ncbi:hypothetical protein [Gloeothece verrucosa]|uniref:Uncharacterized protein n=1 Tax=Gloeothece verrucosa (strain PCC 7822) TaxID=497965 RepID=E0ULI5_GLOV7|nr:hypothetical protein [Gloeothece verrucosa]ADN17815.1 hypothetical protein Cyan7822_5966 [Gloeothece verrucosa PCC 7822]
MDALPLVVNREQLELIYQSISQMSANLKNEQFSDSSKREQNFSTYGTDEYSEASERAKSIEEELKSQLQSWDHAADHSSPIQLSLDSYQLKILRLGIENQMNTLNQPSKKELLSDVIHQLPEESLQEDAD